MAKEVFISHSSQDRATATAVCGCLESAGFNCWIAPRDILPGQPWGESIVRALDECPIMVLLLTAHANASRHVVKEVERADGKLARIVTFRVEDVVLNPSLEYFLSAEHWLDAVTPPVQAHLPELLRAVQTLRGLSRQSTKPVGSAQSAGAVAPRRTATSERELVQEFDELAPDDWYSASRGKMARFFQNLFNDR
jgi:hypothetical protein